MQISNVILISILSGAVICDFRTYKIPNKIIIVGLCMGLVTQILKNQSDGIRYWLLGVTGMTIFLFVLWGLSMMGAGDVKLFGMIGGFLGLNTGMKVFVISMCVGAVISLILLFWRHNFVERIYYFKKYLCLVFGKTYRNLTDLKYMDLNDSEKNSSAYMHFSLPILIAVLIYAVL